MVCNVGMTMCDVVICCVHITKSPGHSALVEGEFRPIPLQRMVGNRSGFDQGKVGPCGVRPFLFFFYLGVENFIIFSQSDLLVIFRLISTLSPLLFSLI